MFQPKGIKFRTQLFLGYASILVLMLISAVIVNSNIAKLIENTRWVDHTYEAIRTAEKCGALLVDMETGVRGFLVAGKEEFLQPYQRGVDSFDRTWTLGKTHTADNPSQTRRWEELKRLKDRWLEEVAHREIDMRREVRAAEAAREAFQEMSGRSLGKELFDELRDELDNARDKLIAVGNREGATLVLRLTMAVLEQETGQRGFLLSGDKAPFATFEKGRADFSRYYDALKKENLSGAGIDGDDLFQIRRLADNWLKGSALPGIEARRELDSHPRKLEDVTALLEAGTGRRLMGEMRRLVNGIVHEEEDLLHARSGEAAVTAGRTVMVTIVGTLIALIAGCAVGYVIVSSVSRQLGGEPSAIEEMMEKISMGDLSMDVALGPQKPTGVYASTIDMVRNLQAAVRQADAVSGGDYEQRIEPRSDKDELGRALSRMTETLRVTMERIRLENRQKSGHAELSEKLRGEQEKDTLTASIITFLAKFLDAQVGAFYLPEKSGMLALSASYAFRERKGSVGSFSVGEGLLGQAAREQTPIIVTDLPEDHIRITSGLGRSAPSSLLVYPIRMMGDIKGVIELGSVRIFSEQEMDFLDLVGESIAIALASADSRTRMGKLLDRTRRQAEDLKSRQQQLKESNTLLETQKKALLESEERLQTQQEELRQTNEELEEQTQLLEEQKTSIQEKNVELDNARGAIEEKARDLELTSKYKSEFLANMSHELRTPLNSILLLSKLLGENREENLSPKQKEYSETIHLSGTELLELINEILDLSKVESGKMEVHIEQLKPADLASRMERTFGPQARNKDLELIVNLAPDLPRTIKTDGQRLEQIVKNLISNALKFTQTGSITLDIHRPDRDLAELGLSRDSAVAFAVTDTGEGIPEEQQKLVFEAFQQADGTTSRRFGGSGLGLSISRELAKLLGGMIRLESGPGKGSRFTVYLPEILKKGPLPHKPDIHGAASHGTTFPGTVSPGVVSHEGVAHGTVSGRADSHGSVPRRAVPHGGDSHGAVPHETSSPTVSAPAAGPEPDARAPETDEFFVPDDRAGIEPGDKTILIIEDDPRFASTLADLSREREYKVLVAGNGETGLHFADYYKPRAIILDIGLPDMDGWSVMARLKDQAGTRHIPVHFISAHDKSIEARRMGAVGFVTKPVTMSMLDGAFEKIERLISSNIRELLIVEDDDVQRRAMVDLIGNGDVRTHEAATGEEAFRLIRSRKFDCMILDLGLPDISGVEFLTRMKEDERITEIPIIVYTGKELTPEEEAVIDEYAEKTIIKGVKSAEKLIDETALFLHRVEADLPEEKRRMIRILHDRESVFTGKKILVVDDDMRNVYAISNVLEEKGLTVLTARNGRKGVETLRENPDTDLVLMDIMMPEMDGYEAIRTIRAEERFKKLPIIALTAKAMKGDRNKCIEAGAGDYLSKPVNTNKLFSMLRVWLY